MILSAASRARELKKGAAKKVITDSGPMVTALEEIEAGVIPGDYFMKFIKVRKKVKNDG
jgi:DNA-directed RNA polymerase subunit K/omega